MGGDDGRIELRPLPVSVRAWSRFGARLPIQTRLRLSRALTSRTIERGVCYRAAGGFALEIDPDDPFQATMLAGIYDPVVAELLERFATPGSVAIDGGAHLGYVSLRLARLVGPSGAVHSFECDPRIVPRLKRHVALSGMPWVTVNACGLLDETMETSLSLPAQLGWASTLPGAWGSTESACVKMVRLDDYLSERGIAPEALSFIKLDVEGSEMRALQGARATLERSAAAVLVEFIPERLRAMGHEGNELPAFMAELGYRPFGPVSGRGGRVRLVPGIRAGAGEDVLFLKARPEPHE